MELGFWILMFLKTKGNLIAPNMTDGRQRSNTSLWEENTTERKTDRKTDRCKYPNKSTSRWKIYELVENLLRSHFVITFYAQLSKFEVFVPRKKYLNRFLQKWISIYYWTNNDLTLRVMECRVSSRIEFLIKIYSDKTKLIFRSKQLFWNQKLWINYRLN